MPHEDQAHVVPRAAADGDRQGHVVPRAAAGDDQGQAENKKPKKRAMTDERREKQREYEAKRKGERVRVEKGEWDRLAKACQNQNRPVIVQEAPELAELRSRIEQLEEENRRLSARLHWHESTRDWVSNNAKARIVASDLDLPSWLRLEGEFLGK